MSKDNNDSVEECENFYSKYKNAKRSKRKVLNRCSNPVGMIGQGSREQGLIVTRQSLALLCNFLPVLL